MQALNDYLVLEVPKPRKDHKGIVIPDVASLTHDVAKVVSVGDRVGPLQLLQPGDLVAFDRSGAVELKLDPMARNTFRCVVLLEQVYCKLTPEELESCGFTFETEEAVAT